MTAEPVITPGGIVIPAAAMTWRFSRATGPGGQGVNTTDSRVELVVDLAALVTSSEVADRVRGKLGDSLRIVALVPAVATDWLFKNDALFELLFDSTGRLTRINAKLVSKGP